MSDRWLYAWGVGSVAFGGASLLVPLYIVQLGAGAVELGVLAATAAAVGAPGAIVFGRLANHVRYRRSLVLVTLVGVAATLAVVPLVTDIGLVIAVNAVLWLLVAAVGPVLTMLVVDDAPEREWDVRIGRLNTYQGYGWAGGLVLGTAWPLVGSRLVGPADGTRLLFWVLAAGAAASAVGAARTLPRPPAAAHVETDRAARKVARLVATSRRGIRGATFVFTPNQLYWATRGLDPRRLRARLDSALATYFVAAACFLTGSAAFWAPLPLFLTDAGFDSGRVFLLYLVASLGSAALYGGAGRLAARYDLRHLLTASLAVRGGCFPLVAVAIALGTASVALGAAALTLTLLGLTWAVMLVVGTAVVTRLAPPQARGDVLGAYTALGAVSGGIGGVLGGWLATFGPAVAFGAAGGLVGLGAVLVLSVRALAGGDRVAAPADEAGRTGDVPGGPPPE